MEDEEIYSDEISEEESTELSSDSETEEDVVPHFKWRNKTQIIYDTEFSDNNYDTDSEWRRCDPKRNLEMFAGNSGVKSYPNNPQSVSEVVGLIIEDDFMEMIATETNRYYDQMHYRYKCSEKSKKWYSATASEMKKFFALNILMGQVRKTTINDYWLTRPSIETPFFAKIMTRHRFLQILRFLHFSNNAEMSLNPSRLHKIQPVVNYLLNKFNTVYKPEQELSLDEAMIPYCGRLPIRNYNPTKMIKHGIFVRVLSEAFTGYVCNFQLYHGEEDNVEEITSLLNKNENLWHHVYMDQNCSSIVLAENLLMKKIRICGPIHKNRSFPKELNDLRLQIGEFDFRRKGEVLVLKWKDKRDIRMISTIHNADIVEIGKINKKTGQQVRKPECIVKYNQRRKRVDLADQYISYYSFLRKSIKWTKKVFMFLLHCALFNSLILYRKLNPHTKITFSKFLLLLAEEWIASASEHHDPKNLPSSSSTAVGRAPHHDAPYRLSGDIATHELEKIPPSGKSKYPQKRCKVCKTHGIRRDTSYICKLCKVPLCKSRCFSIFHTKQKY